MSQMVGDIGYPVLNQFLFQLSMSLSSNRSLIFTLIPTPIPLHKPYISSDVTPYHIVPIHPSTNQPPSVSPSIAVNSLQPGHVLVQYNLIPSSLFSYLFLHLSHFFLTVDTRWQTNILVLKHLRRLSYVLSSTLPHLHVHGMASDGRLRLAQLGQSSP